MHECPTHIPWRQKVLMKGEAESYQESAYTGLNVVKAHGPVQQRPHTAKWVHVCCNIQGIRDAGTCTQSQCLVCIQPRQHVMQFLINPAVLELKVLGNPCQRSVQLCSSANDYHLPAHVPVYGHGICQRLSIKALRALNAGL